MGCPNYRESKCLKYTIKSLFYFYHIKVCFANSPVSGLFILIGLGLADLRVAAAGVVGPLVAVLTGLLLDQPKALIENGLSQFNACLVGTVLASLYPSPVFRGPADDATTLWIFIVLASALRYSLAHGPHHSAKWKKYIYSNYRHSFEQQHFLENSVP